MEKRQAVFYQETGEDGVVELTDTFTLEDAKESYPEWRFRYCELQPKYLYATEAYQESDYYFEENEED
tara:strand:+ start:310 stop:513 length:204 start_codon:yes stop_codon:yes gene_type:complete